MTLTVAFRVWVPKISNASSGFDRSLGAGMGSTCSTIQERSHAAKRLTLVGGAVDVDIPQAHAVLLLLAKGPRGGKPGHVGF